MGSERTATTRQHVLHSPHLLYLTLDMSPSDWQAVHGIPWEQRPRWNEVDLTVPYSYHIAIVIVRLAMQERKPRSMTSSRLLVRLYKRCTTTGSDETRHDLRWRHQTSGDGIERSCHPLKGATMISFSTGNAVAITDENELEMCLP
eukprot:766612-Hanusia_phi.AAC.2